MSKNKKFTLSEAEGLIPQLRFPEFENKREWDKKKLANISEVIMGSSPSSTSYNENKIGLPLLQGNADIKNRLSAPRIYTSEITKECKINDILLSVRAPVGTVAKSLHKACIGRGISALRAIKPNSQEYLYHWLFSYETSWQKISQGGTFDAVNSDDIRNLVVPTPNPKEQQKIASCLSFLDEVIEAHSQKLELLKDHKKGLMQNLFPQEGEKMPKLRFKEFEGEWVEKTLGEIGDFIGGGTPDKSISEYWEGDIPWISSSDIAEDDIHNISITRFINPKAIKESATKLIPKGSVLFVSRVGVGKFAINEKALCTSQDFTSFVSSKVLNYFVAYYFSANKNLLQSLNQGTSIKGFSKSDLEKLKVPIPSKPEQQKIASCLSALDELIKAQAEKIEQLKQHKKGLMQGLFPN